MTQITEISQITWMTSYHFQMNQISKITWTAACDQKD